MADLKNELIATFWKFSTYLVIVVLSVLGMIGNNMYIGKKLTWRQALGLAILAFCSTFVTAIICYKSELGFTGYLITGFVPYACDKIAMAIMAFDWQKGVKATIKGWFRSWLK